MGSRDDPKKILLHDYARTGLKFLRIFKKWRSFCFSNLLSHLCLPTGWKLPLRSAEQDSLEESSMMFGNTGLILFRLLSSMLPSPRFLVLECPLLPTAPLSNLSPLDRYRSSWRRSFEQVRIIAV